MIKYFVSFKTRPPLVINRYVFMSLKSSNCVQFMQLTLYNIHRPCTLEKLHLLSTQEGRERNCYLITVMVEYVKGRVQPQEVPNLAINSLGHKENVYLRDGQGLRHPLFRYYLFKNRFTQRQLKWFWKNSQYILWLYDTRIPSICISKARKIGIVCLKRRFI